MPENEIFVLKLRALWLAIGYSLVALVLYLSLTSDPPDPGLTFEYVDKVYHAIAYFTLMAWFAQIYHSNRYRNLIAVLFILMGVGVEYLQSLNPARYSEFDDMLANSFGVALGLLFTASNAKYLLIRFEKIFVR